VNRVVARSAVDRVLEEVIARSAWRVKLNRLWSMLVDDQPLQEAMKIKMRRQEQELQLVVAEMAKEDRIQRVKELRVKFTSRRQEPEMVDLEDLMLALDITISREERAVKQTNQQDDQEEMDWAVVEGEEHALLDRLQMELGIGLLEDEDWNMVELEPEHVYMDKIILALSQEDMIDGVREGTLWRRANQDDDHDVGVEEWEVETKDDQDGWEDDDPGVGVKYDGAYSEFGRPVEIRINEDGYRAGGSWFEGNWMDPSTDMVGCGKSHCQ
jgi:hypothetical protein